MSRELNPVFLAPGTRFIHLLEQRRSISAGPVPILLPPQHQEKQTFPPASAPGGSISRFTAAAVRTVLLALSVLVVRMTLVGCPHLLIRAKMAFPSLVIGAETPIGNMF
eukprot:677310-Rhodomonas_salina.1